MTSARRQAARPRIENLAGKVLTVKGPIDPNEIGVTLMHEHLFIDLLKHNPPAPDAPATDLQLWNSRLDLSNLHLAREGKPIADNYLLTDEKAAIDEVMEFKRFGGRTIVDVTSIGLRRDPLALRRVSEATGLNVVMGAGWYQKVFHPADMDRRTVEDLADEIIRDITVGVGDTGIRSGIIGEVGINGDPLTPNEIKSVRASARASRATGAAITFHRGGVGKEKHEVLSVVAEEGGDLTRTILGHSDALAGDVPFMLELLDRGVYIQFDVLGRVLAALTYKPVREVMFPVSTYSNTALVADAIPELIAAGYEDRILLSQDVCLKTHLKRYGGTGYSFIQERFLPHLQTLGVTEKQIHKIMVENPMRVLAFAPPG
jgi:phosphotriesterase-related protein